MLLYDKLVDIQNIILFPAIILPRPLPAHPSSPFFFQLLMTPRGQQPQAALFLQAESGTGNKLIDLAGISVMKSSAPRRRASSDDYRFAIAGEE